MPKGKQDPNSNSNDSDLIDRNISFDDRDMHKMWPMIKGLLFLGGIVVGFLLLSYYVFNHTGNWF